MPTLTITPDTAFEILLKARLYDVKVPQSDPDSSSNPSDDNGVDTLEFGAHDNTLHELVSAIGDLNDDEQADLVALILVGRGDFTLAQWRAAREAANDVGRAQIPDMIVGIPLVSDYLEEGLSLFNESLADYIDRH